MENAISADVEARLLLDLWLHQDRLIWGRLCLVAGFQAFALTAVYAIRSVLASFAILIVTLAATGFFLYVCQIDRETRDAYGARLAVLRFAVGASADDNPRPITIGGVPFRADATLRRLPMIVSYGFMVLDGVALYASILFFDWLGGRA